MGQTGLMPKVSIYEVPMGELKDVVILDAEGNFVSRSTSDAPTLKKKNARELFREEEWDFFKRNRLCPEHDRLLLDSRRGPFLIFCCVARSTGLYVGMLFHVKRESLRRFWKRGLLGDVLVSPGLIERTRPRKEGNYEEIELVETRLGYIAGVFDSLSHDNAVREPGELSEWLASRLRALARCFGCSLMTKAYDVRSLREGYVFSLTSFLMIASCLLSLARLTMPENRVRAEICERDGRIWVQMELVITAYRDRESRVFLFDHPELVACRQIADRHELMLDINIKTNKRQADVSICFSPEFHDPAILGLKHPERFDSLDTETET